MHATLVRRSILALACLAAGCASHTPLLDAQFGQAARAALLQQVLDPAAPTSRSVAGMDGEAARSAQAAYQKSFREPVPQAGALTVGVGR